MNEPKDVPEGTARVLMSVTIFKQWMEHMGFAVVDWGEPSMFVGEVYNPVVRNVLDTDAEVVL